MTARAPRSAARTSRRRRPCCATFTPSSSRTGAQHYRTADLIEELCKIEESPWGDWFGKPITGHGLSKLLRPYGIKTMPVRVAGETVRGYKRAQFADAFLRVLGVTGVTSVTSPSASANGHNARNARNASGTGEGMNGRIPASGDDGLPDFIDDAFQNGYVTEAEWLARRKLHALVAEAA